MHSQPVLDPMYYSVPDRPYEAFWCNEAKEMCGGKMPRNCGGGRFGLQCANCAYGSTSTDGKECVKCAEGFLTTPGVMLCVICAFAVLHVVANSTGAAGTAPAKALFATSISQLFHLCQMLGVIANLDVVFPDILGAILKYFKIFILDVGAFDTTCYTGQVTLLGKYGLGVSLSALMMLLFFALWGGSLILSRLVGNRKLAMDGSKVFNTTGLIFNVFFIGVGKSIFRVLECSDQNPNMRKTLINYDGHFCSIEDLAPVLPFVMFFSLFYIGGLIAIYANVIWRAPASFHPNPNFRIRYRFLLGRWNPKFYYWGAMWLMKNIGLAMVAVITNFSFDEDSRQQHVVGLFWIIVFVMPVTLVSIYIKPFKEDLANKLDLIFGGSISLLCVGGMHIKEYNEVTTQIVSLRFRNELSDFSVVLFFLGLIFSLVFATYAWVKADTPPAMTDKIATTLCELHELFLEDRKQVESEFREMLAGLTRVDEGMLHLAMDNIDHVLMCNFPKNGLTGIKPVVSEAAKKLAPCIDGCLPTSAPPGFAPAGNH